MLFGALVKRENAYATWAHGWNSSEAGSAELIECERRTSAGVMLLKRLTRAARNGEWRLKKRRSSSPLRPQRPGECRHHAHVCQSPGARMWGDAGNAGWDQGSIIHSPFVRGSSIRKFIAEHLAPLEAST